MKLLYGVAANPYAIFTIRQTQHVMVLITDEIAFWCSDYSANHDRKIINTSCPAITTPGGKTLRDFYAILTLFLPYANRDAL